MGSGPSLRKPARRRSRTLRPAAALGRRRSRRPAKTTRG
ncbi:Hypothetical Protein RSKD131_1739 [Cereibacter sphaeroides KD131]|nr:Hypothetical Protein RSKD131_1739 [Cereibacter sphaeroides KD131]